MSKIITNNITPRSGSSVGLTGDLAVTGVVTATSFFGDLTGTASEASAAEPGSELETSINSKTSPGKAIALAMVFG